MMTLATGGVKGTRVLSRNKAAITKKNQQHTSWAEVKVTAPGARNVSALLDFVTKPLLDDLFAFADLQRSDGSALLIERNMVARDIFTPAGLGHVLSENALTARMRTQRISRAQASERVQERRGGFLWSAN